MDDKFIHLLKRFVAGDYLSVQELKTLKEWINFPGSQLKISNWAQENWMQASEMETAITFEELVSRIDEQCQSEQKGKNYLSKLSAKFQRIAAILILPFAILLAYFIFSDNTFNNQYCKAIAPKGQKSEIVLPDNTHIWLNSGTQVKYPSSFEKNSRDVFLTGEAYFEVSKDKHKPFIVHASDIAVKVLGTKFNVKAYPDDEIIETSLLSGKINLILGQGKGTKEIEMNPGEKLDYSKGSRITTESGFEADETVAWVNNRLVFRDDTFSNMVKKIERWYNVEIIYDRHLFQDRRLTAELLEGESLERALQIIGKAIDINYRIEKQKVYINPKKKNL